MTSEEPHIASLVVHASPRRIERVAGAIAAIPCAEVHASTASGKLVVHFGGVDDRTAAEALRGLELSIPASARAA